MTLIQRIQRLCKAKNMSISALERELGFANKSLYERKGNELNIRSDRVLTIARYFGVSTDYLLTGEDPHMSEEEHGMLALYRALNNEGKENVLSYLEFVANQAIYKKSDKAI